MNTVSLFHYLLSLIIRCNESLFLIILNSLFTDSLYFPSFSTHGFIQLFFNLMNRIKIINQVWLGLFRDIFVQLYTQEYKATRKQVVKLQLNEKKSKKSHTRLMRWYWKQKPTWRKDLVTHDSQPWIMFCFNWLVIIRKGGGFVWNRTSKNKGVEEVWT